MNVKLVSITAPLINGIESAEELIAYCARVSNPCNQLNSETAPRLLKYCIKHAHWSIFEMADMCVEIKTSRAIAAQILRHKSFSFQEFSQRYSNIASIEDIELRKQAESNRQSSSDVISDPILKNVVNLCLDHAVQTYHKLINSGVAREVARLVLPLATESTLYVKGSVRSWIHYLSVRCEQDTQKEHRLIAESIKDIFVHEFPSIGQALEWV
jgi:thymidylate synthase (FAD)